MSAITTIPTRPVSTLPASGSQPTVDEDSLAGRVALVTGGTRGIGAAISLSLIARGATVAAGSRRTGPQPSSSAKRCGR
jgi:3-oxoacyl-ACP reductase-like protein